MTTRAMQHIPQELRNLTPSSMYNFDELYRFAQVAHASGLFDDVKDAAQAAVKIMRGAELGFPPITSMTAFDVIQKRLYLKPWAMGALINACGYGMYELMESTDKVCRIQFGRKYPDRGWVYFPVSEYTMDEAQRRGLDKRGPEWKNSPSNMLWHRCMGRGAVQHFPELMGGFTARPETAPVTDAQAQHTMDEVWGARDPEPGIALEEPGERVNPPTAEHANETLLWDQEESARRDREDNPV